LKTGCTEVINWKQDVLKVINWKQDVLKVI